MHAGLNFEKFDHAIAILGESLSVWKDFSTGENKNKALINTIQAGVIQNFEIAYDQCWKMMNRWLDINVGRESLHIISRKDLFREAGAHGLIGDVSQWFNFHFARNSTSHNYSEAIALETLNLAKELHDAAQVLRESLSKND
ncbi:MAG: nucleotidyltransferase substrate binding protein [Puniceicoccales bacterium]|nr:nucleotidyltransferase substrate binding protein [Puniceicoccales bacterium]